jgi:hypothetical protein
MLRSRRPITLAAMGMTLAILATVLFAVTAVGSDDGTASAQSETGSTDGVRTLIFRTVENPQVANPPQNCPFSNPNLRLGADVWSLETGPKELASEVVKETVDKIGTASACGQISGPLTPDGPAVPFYVEFTLADGTYKAQGDCHVISNDVPQQGIILADCGLGVDEAPGGMDGVATSMSIFNAGRIAGVDTGSFWTLRLYPTS